MKQAFAFIGGLFAIIIAFSLAGSMVFQALAAVCAYALYFLFFGNSEISKPWLLAGVVIMVELLGTAHFGQASALGVIILVLQYIFLQRLRFTSIYLRYIVSLTILLFGYATIMFPPARLLNRLELLALLYPFLCVAAYIGVSLKSQQRYELL